MDNEGVQSEDENTNDSYTDSKAGLDNAHGAMDCLVAVGRLPCSLDKPIGKTNSDYTQSPIIKNGPIRNDAEILGKFKERMLSRSKLRNA